MYSSTVWNETERWYGRREDEMRREKDKRIMGGKEGKKEVMRWGRRGFEVVKKRE